MHLRSTRNTFGKLSTYIYYTYSIYNTRNTRTTRNTRRTQKDYIERFGVGGHHPRQDLSLSGCRRVEDYLVVSSASS